MTTLISLAEAQTNLHSLIAGLQPDEEIVITQDARPIARLIAEPSRRRRPPPGFAAELIVSFVDDDEHLRDFREYMS